MTDREVRILQYWLRDIDREYEEEHVFLSHAKLMLSMFENAVVVREANPAEAGISDLLVCYHGRFIALELKANDNEPSKRQEKFIEDVIAAGGKGLVCRTMKQVFDTVVH